jgi:hypothetical protein
VSKLLTALTALTALGMMLCLVARGGCRGEPGQPGSATGEISLCRLHELHQLSWEVLPALVHLLARVGNAALHQEFARTNLTLQAYKDLLGQRENLRVLFKVAQDVLSRGGVKGHPITKN